MSLLQKWNDFATEQHEGADPQKFWNDYFMKEKDMYAAILSSEELIKGKVSELAEKFGVDDILMMGFLDGMNDSLKTPMDLETIEADSDVSLDYDKEKLYYNMVGAKASWLYELPEWDNLLSAEKRKELYKAQKTSKTVVKEQKVGRNDPCPCGSGKKYKKCCGRDA